jgi:VanZ family protein
VALALFAAIAYFTISPIDMRPAMPGALPSLDHSLAFSAFGLFLTLADPKQWLRALAIVAVVALGLELLQYVAPGRHPRVEDAMIKLAAGVAGVVLSLLSMTVWTWRRRRRA